jgi:uroporphyrinogen decarboxylase
MNKRDIMINLINGQNQRSIIPAAFFIHFSPEFHQGQAAIDKHIEYFRYTNMDFVKVQYEQKQPAAFQVQKLEDWKHVPLYPIDFHEPTLHIVDELVKGLKKESLVIMTLYSPFMWAKHISSEETLQNHLLENPEVVKKGLDIMAENVIRLAQGCIRVGVDGFYASSQGGEAFRFKGTNIFEQYIKPTDLAVWDEIKSCNLNILHVCDIHGGYDDFSPFLDYPGHIVNCSLKLGNRSITSKEVSKMFNRPFMGGMEREGVIATGGIGEIQKTVKNVLDDAPERFVLAADCTMLSNTPWDHLKAAIDTAHQFTK